MGGSAAILSQILEVIKKSTARKTATDGDEEEQNSCYSCFAGLLGCFNFAWFICGKFTSRAVKLAAKGQSAGPNQPDNFLISETACLIF